MSEESPPDGQATGAAIVVAFAASVTFLVGVSQLYLWYGYGLMGDTNWIVFLLVVILLVQLARLTRVDHWDRLFALFGTVVGAVGTVFGAGLGGWCAEVEPSTGTVCVRELNPIGSVMIVALAILIASLYVDLRYFFEARYSE